MDQVIRKALKLNLRGKENHSVIHDDLLQDLARCELFEKESTNKSEKLLYEKSDPQLTLMRFLPRQ